MTIDTEYNLQQLVYIKQLKTWGKVVSFFVDCESEVQYRVRYFVELKPETCYFHAEELSLQEDNSMLGFKS